MDYFKFNFKQQKIQIGCDYPNFKVKTKDISREDNQFFVDSIITLKDFKPRVIISVDVQVDAEKSIIEDLQLLKEWNKKHYEGFEREYYISDIAKDDVVSFITVSLAKTIHYQQTEQIVLYKQLSENLVLMMNISDFNIDKNILKEYGLHLMKNTSISV